MAQGMGGKVNVTAFDSPNSKMVKELQRKYNTLNPQAMEIIAQDQMELD